MSDRRLFGLFSGTHIVTAFVATLLAPSVLYGAVTFSNVSLVNPSTGVAASVDNAGHLSTVDPYAFYRNNPLNQIDFYLEGNIQGSGCNVNQWTLPAGKAFIITAMSGYEWQYTGSVTYAKVIVFGGVGCSGHTLTAHGAGVSESSPYAPITVDYGVGIPVAAGSVISVYSSNNTGPTWIHGYLVPSSFVTSSQFIGP